MDTPEQRIQIAVQKTGRLTDHSIDLLQRCGLKLTRSKDQLFLYGENMPIDLTPTPPSPRQQSRRRSDAL